MNKNKLLKIITSIGIIILACSIIGKIYMHYPVNRIDKKIDELDNSGMDMLESSRQLNEVVRLDHLSNYGISMGIFIIIGCCVGFLSLKYKF